MQKIKTILFLAFFLCSGLISQAFIPQQDIKKQDVSGDSTEENNNKSVIDQNFLMGDSLFVESSNTEEESLIKEAIQGNQQELMPTKNAKDKSVSKYNFLFYFIYKLKYDAI